ncbi:MAG TPA: prephenate dehydratase [Candidatus Nanopelagicaceae bacterium]|nr:prephenate dehydratase [Candidatus Nanopelagicaceae bacterium]
MTRYSYLGPAGTFAQAALNRLMQAEDVGIPYANVTAALNAVRSGEVESALVPIENSVEGVVARTLDELAIGDPLVITAETTLPVTFVLMAKEFVALDSITRVSSHPHAEAQCRHFIAAQLPHAEVILTSSTAQAASEVAQSDSLQDAAIAAAVAAENYGLKILASEIGDNDDAVTRFVVVSKPGKLPDPTGHDRTSLAVFIGADHAGALLEILTELAVRGVNLTFIQSRPTGRELGHYHFVMDAEGHVVDARVGDALSALKRICEDVRFLGSYPRADRLPPTNHQTTSDANFLTSSHWVEELRNGLAT